jgi:cyanophycinase-like exopeptidase
VRVAIVPTAAARGRPDLAAANGIAAVTRVGEGAGIPVQAAAVAIVDAASAADPRLAARLAEADLVHFPGGDPDLIPSLYPGTAALAALLAVLARGAVVAGASAGAMALGSWTWTPGGGVAGLGLVPGILVVPHADERSWADNMRRFGGSVPLGLGVLGLCERTGVLIPTGRDTSAVPWRVVGEVEIRWLPPGSRDLASTVVVRAGDAFFPTAA